MDKMLLRPYEATDNQSLIAMMYEYFNSDLDEDVSYEQLSIVVAHVEYEMGIYPMYLNVLCHRGRTVGFIIFQIDTPDNPWGLKPGWGFIREMYIDRGLRRLGLGKIVVDDMCSFLVAAGVENVYLTSASDGSQIFWECLGFCDSGEICDKNDLRIYSKKL